MPDDEGKISAVEGDHGKQQGKGDRRYDFGIDDGNLGGCVEWFGDAFAAVKDPDCAGGA